MSAAGGGPRPGERDAERAATLGLVAALAPVLADVAGPDAVHGARAAAQALGLAGLERLLEACAPRAGLAWPAELAPALDRVRRLATRATETGGLGPFREADRELGGLAGEIGALRWSTSRPARGDAAPTPVATLGLAEALEDLPLADDASRELARRVRVVAPVAASLRAALDWIAGGSTRPLSLRAEESLLEVRCEHVDGGGLSAAAEVLASVGGSVGPGLSAGEPWLVRVPLLAGRELHLMVARGELSLAIPWHAVLRLHMGGAAELAERESAHGGWPVVWDVSGSGREPAATEAPLVLVAHGRKRAWIVADRLVWRLPAERVAPEVAAPVAGLVAVVRTEAGERYWLADPAWLLRDVEAPELTVADSAPAPAATPALAPPRETPRLAVLTPADVRPLAAPREDRAPRPGAPAPAPPARPRPPVPAPPAPSSPLAAPPTTPARAPDSARREPAPAPATRTARTALVAEDSITARIFLARLLARQGFDVRTVDTAAALRAELERGGWTLACVDIELPDETGTAFLASLVARHGGAATFVALVRDADDRAAARRAGIERLLRKPFDERELELLLGRLGLPAPGER